MWKNKRRTKRQLTDEFVFGEGTSPLPGASSPTVTNRNEFTSLAGKLLPILLDSGYLPKKDILTCRLLNKEVKTTLDSELMGNRQPSWLTDAFTLGTSFAIAKFLNKAEGMRGKPSTSLTPLFIWLLNVTAGTDNMKTIELLRKYGPLLLKVRLAITLDANRPLPLPTLIQMIAALKYIPNVTSLTLAFEKIPIDFHDDCWESKKNEPLPSSIIFPRLNSLSELTLECLPTIIPDFEQYFYPPPVKFLEPFFKACGSKITKLTCHQYFFDDEGGDDIIIEHVPNIQDLTLNLVDFMGESAMQTLSFLRNLKLKRVAFIRNTKIGGYWKPEDDGWGDNEKGILMTIGDFKDTLEELHFYKLINITGLKGLDSKMDWKKYIMPKLKGLTVSADNLNSDMWQVLQKQFPNLEWIRFEPGVKYIYVICRSDSDSSDSDSSDSESEEEDSEEEEEPHPQPPLPDAEVRKRLFDMFPQLKSLIWIKGRGEGTGRAPREIFFNRLAPYKVCERTQTRHFNGSNADVL